MGVYVSPGTVPYSQLFLSGNESASLVSGQFNNANTIANTQIALANTYLSSLSTLFASADMPDTDITYDFQDITLNADFTSNRPEAPDCTMGDVAVPQMGILRSISVPSITIPTYALIEPTQTDMVYNEPTYNSALQAALQAALIDFVENGGTGLGATVEAALWARAQARQDILNERTYSEAEEFYASRGYSIPAGALGGRLTEALAEQTRADAQLNYEVTIEQARLARAQTEHSINASLTLEGQDKERFNNMANRTLEYAKASVQVIIDLYLAKVQAFVAQTESAKLSAEAAKIRVDAVAAANKSETDVYAVSIEGYKAQVQAEIGIVEALAKVYGYEIAGYEADAKVAAMDLEAQIKTYQAKIDQANNQTTLTLKEAEMTIQGYLGALQLTSEALQAGGNTTAQIAASALSAVNASASLGASHSVGDSKSHSSSMSLSNSGGLSEQHYYDETAA